MVFLWKVMRFEPPLATPRHATATLRRLVPGLLQPLLRIAHGFPVLSIATVPAYRWRKMTGWQKPMTAPCIIYIHITYITFIYNICNIYICIYIYILYTHIKEFNTSCRKVSTWNNKWFPVKRTHLRGFGDGKPPDRKSPEAGGFSKAQRTGASWVKLEHPKNQTSMDWLTLPILDTLQKIKFFAGERRYSH